MKKVRLIFCTNNKPQDVLLRVGMMFKFSHVGIVTPWDTVIHATTPYVREDSLEEFEKKYPKNEIREYPVRSLVALEWLQEQIGKPYDMSAIFGFILHRDWAEQNKWFCSELAAEFLEKCGSPRFRNEDVKSVWPQTIYVVR